VGGGGHRHFAAPLNRSGDLPSVGRYHHPIRQTHVTNPSCNPDHERLAGEKLKRLMRESSRAETRRDDGENRHHQ
jgi:hypothetical protein